MAVAAGCLPLCAVGAALARVEYAGAAGQPDLPAIVVVAGPPYPAVFGAAGEAAGSYSSRATISPHGSKPWRS